VDKPEQNEEQDKRLTDLYWIALILFIGPMLYGLFFALVSNIEPNAMGLDSFCGFLLLVYVGVRKFQRELHRKKAGDGKLADNNIKA
jgi:hypothetical protein